MNFHEVTAYAGWCTLFSYPELEVILRTKAFFDISDSLFYKNRLNTRSALN